MKGTRGTLGPYDRVARLGAEDEPNARIREGRLMR